MRDPLGGSASDGVREMKRNFTLQNYGILSMRIRTTLSRAVSRPAPCSQTDVPAKSPL